MLYYARPGRLARDIHSSLLVQLANTIPWIVFTTLHGLHYTRLERLVRDKHFSLLVPLTNMTQRTVFTTVHNSLMGPIS